MTNQNDAAAGSWSENFGFDDMDPDDPNYVHRDMLKKMEKLYQEMPDGWSRNTDWSKTKAPFIHVSGEISFKHPNRPLLDKMVKEMQEAAKENVPAAKTNKRIHAVSSPLRGQVKKLRMMLQAGLPMAAVEQKAKLEGIDMSLVLGEANEQAADEPKTSDEDAVNNTIPDPLIKKYKRMIKSGVPLMGVQATATIDGHGRWTPADVAKALEDVLDTTKDTHSQHYAARTKLPRRQASDTEEALASLENAAAQVVEAFSPVDDDKVSFPANSNLATLVRKMAQTVLKRASTSKDSTMVVDNRTLYNALGALKGVQTARDCYNSTCDGVISFQEIKAKRQGFAEIARTIGMSLPKEVSTYVEIDGLDEVIKYIEKVYEKELTVLKSMLEDGYYDFDSLAQLYGPGSKVVAKNAGGGGVDMICQVSWNRFEEGRTIMGKPMKYFKVCFQYIVAVGASHATMAEVTEGLEFFEDRRKILTSLTFVPLAAYHAEEQERLLARYRRRGEIYNKVALCGTHSYMSYGKGCFFLKRGGGTNGGSSAAANATGGRIIVDTQGAYDHGHSLGVGYDPMVMGIKYKYKEYSLHLRALKQSDSVRNADGSVDDDGLVLFEQVPHDMLEMVWPSVVGFSLSAKGWGDVLVDGLEDIQWQEDIFDCLVLPEKRKMMVKALVRHSTNSFQDLVQGKGEGTIFLLYGPPGVGKTLTAESVAELLHKPLYSLSLGTLGTTASELEVRLGQIMTLTAKWDALILLDEADCFLETRSSNSSLERNAMVSVMLKLVEYFSGIMFLTSNRIDSLDPAFQTRITLALRYEQLNEDARTKVWKSLLVKSGFETEVDTAAIDSSQLAKATLNGREIKNALRLAMAMAAEMEQPLSQEILLDTVEIVNDYKKSMSNPEKYGSLKEGDSAEEA